MAGGLFGREEELGALRHHAATGTDRILMLLGPKNSGKTALLKHFKDMQLGLPTYLLDMRQDIQSQVMEWTPKQEEDGVDVDLALVLRELVAYDGQAAQGKRPMFIIDHAERITNRPRAKQVLDCLVGIAQNKIGTVIMSTSDDSLREDWIGHELVQPVHVDHFSEAQAKAFLSRFILESPAPFGDEEWQKIYRVCGGCPLLLKRCAQDAPLPLDGVLDDMVASVTQLVYFGLSGGEGWEGETFRQVMELIVEDGAVEWPTVCNKVFGNDDASCSSQLKAMAARGVIHIQYAPKLSVKLVMAASPPHRQAMRQVMQGEPEASDDDEAEQVTPAFRSFGQSTYN